MHLDAGGGLSVFKSIIQLGIDRAEEDFAASNHTLNEQIIPLKKAEYQASYFTEAGFRALVSVN